MSESSRGNLVKWLTIIGTLLLLVIAAGCFSVYALFFQSRIVDDYQAADGKGGTVVVYTKKNLNAFAPITPADVGEQRISSSRVPLCVIGKLSDAIDRLTVKEIGKGEILRPYLVRKPAIVSDYMDLGQAYSGVDDKKALRMFHQAIEESPFYESAYQWAGYTNLELGNLDEALDNFGTAIRINSKSAYSYQYRARVWIARKKYNKAIDDCNTAIRIDPEFEPAYTTMGDACFWLRDYKKAIENFTKAIELDKDNDYAYRRRSRANLKLSNFDSAKSDIDRCLELKYCDLKNAYKVKGDILVRQNQYRKAITAYDKSLKVSRTAGALDGKAYCHVKLKEPEKALAEITEAFSLNKSPHPWYYQTRAATHYQLGDLEAAMTDVEKALSEAQPIHAPPGVHALKAVILDRKGKTRDAVDYLTKSIEWNGNDGQLYYERGRLLRKLGRRAAAEADLRKAKQLKYSAVENDWLRSQ